MVGGWFGIKMTQSFGFSAAIFLSFRNDYRFDDLAALRESDNEEELG